MIAIARRKNAHPSITFEQQDATALPYASGSFDAVFDGVVIHHIPNWKDCLKELKRVLRPGGHVVIEDLSIETFSTPFGRILRRLLDHPYPAMYTEDEFVQYLREVGFKISFHRTYKAFLRSFVVVAKKGTRA